MTDLDDLVRDAVSSRAAAAPDVAPDFAELLAARHVTTRRRAVAAAGGLVVAGVLGLGVLATADDSAPAIDNRPADGSMISTPVDSAPVTMSDDGPGTTGEESGDEEALRLEARQRADQAAALVEERLAEEGIAVHVVRAGEWPLLVADRYCTSVATLARLNRWNDSSDFPFPGETLYVPDPDTTGCAVVDDGSDGSP